MTQLLLPEMLPIPAGTFMMGSPKDEDWRLPNERLHEVRVAAFDLSRNLVSNAEFRRFRPDHCSGNHDFNSADFDGDDQPAVLVRWTEAVAYARWLSLWSGERYRLPTEAEWEYACRAGSTGPYTPEDLAHAHYANGRCSEGRDPIQTRPVGLGAPNAWGLCDMHGNVWEWTSSDYSEDYDGAELCPAPPERRDGLVVRGGAWTCDRHFMRAAARNHKPAHFAWNHIGFRLARDRAE